MEKMTLKQVYSDKKRELNGGYMDWYHLLQEAIENDKDYALADDELDELIVDLMLSNVLGEVTTFERVSKLLKN